jgi:hypothetical protein
VCSSDLSKGEALIVAAFNRALQKGGRDQDTILRIINLIDAAALEGLPVEATSEEQDMLTNYRARLRREWEEEARKGAVESGASTTPVKDAEKG